MFFNVILLFINLKVLINKMNEKYGNFWTSTWFWGIFRHFEKYTTILQLFCINVLWKIKSCYMLCQMCWNIVTYITWNNNMYTIIFFWNMFIYDNQAQNINFFSFIQFFHNFEIFIRRFTLSFAHLLVNSSVENWKT